MNIIQDDTFEDLSPPGVQAFGAGRIAQRARTRREA